MGVQDRDKWMTILDMGYHVASRYNVILVSLSKNIKITLFSPVVSPPIYVSRHKPIAVDFVNNGHWIYVKLKLDCPLPSVVDH